MSLLGDIMARLSIDPGYEDEDDYYDEEDNYVEEKPSRNLFSSLRRNQEDSGDDNYEEEAKPSIFPRRNNNITPVRRPNMEVSVVRPTSIEDSRDIVDSLLAGKAVILNMEGLHTDVAQRIIDFTSGATYSMDGKLQKISNYFFIATPSSVDLSGDFQELLSNGNFETSGLNFRI